jgi:ParB-like chromosome segregation protein Spo0J
MKLSNIKPNPNNPRLIKDDKFNKLVQSIKDFPEMMEKRPIVCVTDVDGKIYPLGGNMRYKALKEIGYKDIPETWVTMADDWTEEKRREFVIKDNVGFGEWDWEQLGNEWDAEELEAWGLDVPEFDLEPDYDDLIGEEKNKPATMKITFESPEQLQKAEIDIQELLDRKYPKAYFSVSAGEL